MLEFLQLFVILVPQLCLVQSILATQKSEYQFTSLWLSGTENIKELRKIKDLLNLSQGSERANILREA